MSWRPSYYSSYLGVDVLKPKKTSLGMSDFDGKRLAGVWCYSRPRCKHSVFKARGGNSTGFRVRRISALETTLRRSQEFDSGLFVDLLEHKTPTRMDPLKGRIRSFLLDSTQNYPANEAERNRCLKRGDNLTPEEVFAARRALMLLKHAIHQKMAFEGLKAFLDFVYSKDLPSDEQTAAALQVSVETVKTLIHRSHEAYLVLVRSQIEQIVLSSEILTLRFMNSARL